MVWECVWSTSTEWARHVTGLLHHLSAGSAAAWNATRPALDDALRWAARLAVSWERAYLGWRPLDEFQTNLLLVIVTILAVNVLLVYLAWSKYGERIVLHFTAADSSDKIRDLGLRQNLPREYTPKY